jgi:uncharacterized membrane protein YbhN (UPF0104 family)
MSKTRTRLLEIVKWSFSIGVLVLLVRSGKLSLADIQTFLSNPRAAVICLLLIMTLYATAFVRWRLLLRSQGIFLKYREVFQLGMLGQFFSTFIPGAVGGDLIKAVYVARRFPDRKMQTVSTILMDRIIGLMAMIVLGATAFLVGRERVLASPHPSAPLVAGLGWALVAGAVVVLLGLSLLPWIGRSLPAEMPASWKHRFPRLVRFEGLYLAAKAYQSRTSSLWLGMGMSFFMHMLNVSVLFTVARSVFGAAPWGNVDAPLFILGSILGLASTAVPVAPMGLGVGQFAFAAIFQAMGAPTENFGALLITGLQMSGLLVNLTGSVFFATYRHEVREVSSELA